MLSFPDGAFGIDVDDGAGKKRQGVLKGTMGRPCDLMGFRYR